MDLNRPHFVCRLRKALNSLKQAPRAWFEKLKNALLMRGFTGVVSDSSLFILNSVKVRVYALIYINDILLTGFDLVYIDALIQELNTEFSLKDLGELNFF